MKFNKIKLADINAILGNDIAFQRYISGKRAKEDIISSDKDAVGVMKQVKNNIKYHYAKALEVYNS